MSWQVVLNSWGSHCDSGNYAGWVLAYNETTLAQVGVLNVVPNGNDGGIWSAGSGSTPLSSHPDFRSTAITGMPW